MRRRARAWAALAACLAMVACDRPVRRDRTVDLFLELPRATLVLPGRAPGTGADPLVQPRLLVCRGEGRSAIPLPPPASLSYRLTPAPGARLVSAVALDDASVAGAAARFIVEVTPGKNGAPVVLFDRRTHAAEPAPEGWVPLDVDLSAHAGHEVTLTLRTEADGDATGVVAGFASPQLLSDGRRGRLARGVRTIVLASLDTLRVDALGAYGDPRMLSPRLDAFTRTAELHPEATTPFHGTLLAHASLVTSAYPEVTKVGADRGIAPSLTTLAERLAAEGFEGAAFVAAIRWLDPRYGFGRGLTTYFETTEASASRTRRARSWMEHHIRKDLFLFVHYFDAHSDDGALPYEATAASQLALAPRAALQPRCASPGGASAELERMNHEGRRHDEASEAAMRDGYGAGVADLDLEVGRLLAELRGSGRGEEATVVIVSDHGEEISDHGRYLHTQLYPETTRALLAISRPGLAPGLSVDLASLVDVAPTILAAAGIAAPATFQGVDLARVRPRTSYTLGEEGRAALRDRDREVVRQPDGRLVTYERELDPGQERPLLDDGDSALARELAARRQEHEALAARQSSGDLVPLAPDEEERLRSLGYLPAR